MRYIKTFETHSIFTEDDHREVVSYGNWTIDLNKYTLKRGDEYFKNLPHLVFVLFYFLIKKGDEFSTTNDIHEFIYGDEEGRLNMVFVKARQLLGSSSIEFVKNKGYKISKQ